MYQETYQISKRIKYCKTSSFNKYTHNYKHVQIIYYLIKIYAMTMPEASLFDGNNNLCMRKAKKYICLKMHQYVERHHLFNNDLLNRNFKISPKQLSKLLNKNSKRVPVFTAVIIYYLVEEILRNNGIDELWKMNSDLDLDINSRSGFYFLHDLYSFLVEGASKLPHVNINGICVDYIAGCFQRIDDRIDSRVLNWYEMGGINNNFNFPSFYEERE